MNSISPSHVLFSEIVNSDYQDVFAFNIDLIQIPAATLTFKARESPFTADEQNARCCLCNRRVLSARAAKGITQLLFLSFWKS